MMENEDSFWVNLRGSHAPDTSYYPEPSRLIAISDIEGNFNALASFLQANKVVDLDLHWSFGTGHLVLVGDFVDRGNNVMHLTS